MSDFPIEIYEEYLRYTDDDPLPFITENRAPTLSEQNYVLELYDTWGITNGRMGSWTSEYVLRASEIIESSDLSEDEKYFMLDSLRSGLDNNYDRPVGDWSMWERISRKIDKHI